MGKTCNQLPNITNIWRKFHSLIVYSSNCFSITLWRLLTHNTGAYSLIVLNLFIFQLRALPSRESLLLDNRSTVHVCACLQKTITQVDLSIIHTNVNHWTLCRISPSKIHIYSNLFLHLLCEFNRIDSIFTEIIRYLLFQIDHMYKKPEKKSAKRFHYGMKPNLLFNFSFN